MINNIHLPFVGIPPLPFDPKSLFPKTNIESECLRHPFDWRLCLWSSGRSDLMCKIHDLDKDVLRYGRKTQFWLLQLNNFPILQFPKSKRSKFRISPYSQIVVRGKNGHVWVWMLIRKILMWTYYSIFPIIHTVRIIGRIG